MRTGRKHQRGILVTARDLRASSALAAMSANCGAAICQAIGLWDCLARLRGKSLDVLVIDPGRRAAMGVIREARRIWPWQSCIALVGKGDVSQAIEIVWAGAADCLERPVAPKRRLVVAFERELDFAAVLGDLRVFLTRTELKVLHLILAGMVAGDIGEHLGRSKWTIDVHRKNIFRNWG